MEFTLDVSGYKIAPNHTLLQFIPDVSVTDAGYYHPEGRKQKWARIIETGPVSWWAKLFQIPHLRPGMLAFVATNKGHLVGTDYIVVKNDVLKLTVHAEDIEESEV